MQLDLTPHPFKWQLKCVYLNCPGTPKDARQGFDSSGTYTLEKFEAKLMRMMAYSPTDSRGSSLAVGSAREGGIAGRGPCRISPGRTQGKGDWKRCVLSVSED